jgi:hypothetical protein
MDGREVSAGVEGEPILLVKGLKVRTGPVATALDTLVRLYPGEEKSIKLPDGEASHFHALGSVEIVRSKEDEEHPAYVIRQYRFAYSRTPYQSTQEIGPFNIDSESSPPAIEWAGDLDQDGHLDMLVTFYGFNSSESILYLSSAATAPGLLLRVASRRHLGC